MGTARTRLGWPRVLNATTASGLAGAALTVWGLASLAAIPRGPREFAYQNPPGGSAWWPLPFAPANGFTPEQLASHVARAIWLFPACVLLGFACRRRGWRLPGFASPWPLVCTGALLTTALALGVLRGVPLQDDEATYLMQAELLSRRLVADPTHPAAATFAEPFTIFTRAGLSGMYPFGTPLVLAPGVLWGIPWLGQVLMVALTLAYAFGAAARTSPRPVAWLGTALLALSPMLTFTSAGFLSQAPSLMGVTAAVYGLAIGGWRGGALAGTGLGFAFVARPQMAVPSGLVLLGLYAWRDRRLLAALTIAAVPWLAALAMYNAAVTGSPWLQPRAAYTGELEAFGFGTIVRHYEHTPPKALALAGVALVRLNGWALGWPISIAGAVLWLALGCPSRAAVGPWAAIAAAAFAFQAGYGFLGTSETGALYHYAALPFFAFSSAAALHAVEARRFGGWIRATALVCVLLGTGTFYVEHALRIARLSGAIEGPRRSLDVQVPALIFEDAWGARPQAGWVFGLPFRERAPSAPIVRYPRAMSPEARHLIIARWPDRRCYELRYDATSAQYELTACGD